MSKNINNTMESYGTFTKLFLLFCSLFFILLTTKDIFAGLWGDESQSIFNIAQTVLAILMIWSGFKAQKLSQFVKSNSKLLKQSKDERLLEIDYKSRAAGFIGMIAFIMVYLTCSEIQKGYYKNTFLHDINGAYIAMMVFAVGGLVAVISAFYLDKE